MAQARNVPNNNVPWPMSNEELRDWFSREHIPLEELVQIWLHMDQNEATKSEMEKLAKEPNSARELETRLRPRIQFGTAGAPPRTSHLRNRFARAHGSRLLPYERFNRDTSFSGDEVHFPSD